MEPKEICLKQLGCSLLTQVGRREVKYDSITIKKLPYLFGEFSDLVNKDLSFYNTLDDSIIGMHLGIDTLPWQESQLALINYSCSGWNLRV